MKVPEKWLIVMKTLSPERRNPFMYARKDRLVRLRCPLDLAEVQHQSDPGLSSSNFTIQRFLSSQLFFQ